MLKAAQALIGQLPGFLVGAAVVALLGFLIVMPIERHTARQAGFDEATTACQEARRLAREKADRDHDATQATIDAGEAAYHQLEAKTSAEMAALNQTLEEELANAPVPVPGAACRPVIPRRVLDSLDRLGRSAPRVDPAKPHPAVP